jgi:DUF177 domain-containing protein
LPPRRPDESHRDPSFYESLTPPLRYSALAMTSLDLRRVRLRSGEQHRDRQEIELEPLTFGGQRYLPVPEKPEADLTITRAATGTVFDLRFTGRLHGPCQRCLEDAVIDRSIVAQEYQATNPDADELRTPYIVDDHLDLSAWARDALVLSLPEQILCREDCAGLCPMCGADLNVEPHEHEEETADPRWEALEQLRERL